jgi:hypothetical protein
VLLTIKQDVRDAGTCKRRVYYQEQIRNHPAGYRVIVPEDAAGSCSYDLQKIACIVQSCIISTSSDRITKELDLILWLIEK